MKEPSANEFAAGSAAADTSDASQPGRFQGLRLPGQGEAGTTGDRMARLRVPLMLGGVVLVLGAALFAYLSSGRYESTDDAYVRVAGVDVSSNLSGRVVEVDVKENQLVHAGQVLFKLDPAPYEIATAQAEAQLADARQSLNAELATYRQRQVDVKNAESAAAWRAREAKREQGLLAAGAVSQSEYDQAAHEAEAAQLQVSVTRQALAAALANLGGRPDQSIDVHPSVRNARSQLDRAELQKSWTVIRAPQDGRVTKVEQLQVGDYINAATPVFHLVTPRVWVDAAFKENQLKNMRAGEQATIRIDAYPSRTFCARIDSLSPGTDQTFSLMPAENATGNWVKVVQRLPVRLVFCEPPQMELQGGLSARVKVDTGHKRSLFGSRR